MKHTMHFLLLSIVIVSCSNSTSPHYPNLDEAFEIELGEEVVLRPAGLRLTFTDVPGDSRCPANATCFWAGNAEVSLQVNGSEAALNTYLEPQEITVSGFTVRMITLSPYPETGISVNREDYVASLVVTRQ